MSFNANDYSVLLVFKDSLPISTGQGFSLVSESASIREHFTIAARGPLAADAMPNRDQSFFPDLMPMVTRPRAPRGIGQDSCVWGWWRKPWECHPRLFKELDRLCQQGATPNILLYNQYLGQIYLAKLLDIYYNASYTTVNIPENWREWCPNGYRDAPRLCGAFLSLAFIIEGPDKSPRAHNAEDVFSNLRVDSLSFESFAGDAIPVIAPPRGIDGICGNIARPP